MRCRGACVRKQQGARGRAKRCFSFCFCFGVRFVLFSVGLGVVLVGSVVAFFSVVSVVALPPLLLLIREPHQDHQNHPQGHRQLNKTKNKTKTKQKHFFSSTLAPCAWSPSTPKRSVHHTRSRQGSAGPRTCAHQGSTIPGSPPMGPYRAL